MYKCNEKKVIFKMLKKTWMKWLDGVYMEDYPSKKDDINQLYISDNELRVNRTIEIVKKFFEKIKIDLHSITAANIGYSSFDQKFIDELNIHLVNIIPNKSFLPEDVILNNESLDYFDLSSEGVMPTRTYDLLICTEVIEHLFSDDRKIFTNLANLINPNGFLVLSVPNSVSLVRRILVMLGKNNIAQKKKIIKGTFGGYGHIREYASYEIEYFLNRSFKLALKRGINDFPFTRRLPFSKFLPVSLSDDMLFIAKKITLD